MTPGPLCPLSTVDNRRFPQRKIIAYGLSTYYSPCDKVIREKGRESCDICRLNTVFLSVLLWVCTGEKLGERNTLSCVFAVEVTPPAKPARRQRK